MITIQKYQPSMKTILSDMMVPYMTEMNCDVSEHTIRGKLADFIEEQCKLGHICILLVKDREEPVGFSVYQIDAPESDWCKRPGWGFIREFYIKPEYRVRGIGAQLATYTENALKELGAEKLYLTSGPASKFWERCGWKNTKEFYNSDLVILEKLR